jgi:hemoglobin
VNSPATKSLYKRIGGYDVIAAVIDDLLAFMRADPAFERFQTGRSLGSRNRTRQLIVDQFCSLSGGPCLYTGRDMKTSHAGLNISAREWEANIKHAAAALDKSRVPPEEKAEFLALFERYRDEIVEKS